MAIEGGCHSEPSSEQHLEIAFDSGYLPVSNLSSLLRVAQAAVREVARSGEGTRQAFSQQPQPVLMLSAVTTDEELRLYFVFQDPLDSGLLPELSSQVFAAFMERFAQFLKGLPQPGLWGDAARGGRRRGYESDVSRRMNQLRLELRRFPRARLSFNGRSIRVEGNRMEID